jgi:hypothetical protein
MVDRRWSLGIALLPLIVIEFVSFQTQARAQATLDGVDRNSSISIEDFSKGVSGWNFEGNCWDGAPTAAARYGSQITGFRGTHYLMSAPGGNNSRTGVAISPGFELSKDYLIFKVAGGASRNTRVEVLVDDKLDRWVCGDNSLDFKDVCIDLSHWHGHKLGIRVVDASSDENYGFIMVDDFRLSDVSPHRYYLNPEDFGTKAVFINECTFFRTPLERKQGRKLTVGLSPRQFDFAINEVYKRMVRPDMDHRKGRSINELATMIGNGVDEELETMDLKDKPPLLRKWLLAEGICAWVNTHVTNDRTIVDPQTGKVDVKRLAIPLLSMEVPTTECSGHARFTQSLATALGLSCFHAVGSVRLVSNSVDSRHSWNYFDFGDGIFSIADTGNGGASLSGARSFPGKGMWDWNLPKSPISFELALAQLLSYQRLEGPFEDEHYIGTSALSGTTMNLDAWRGSDVSHLQDVYKRHLAYEASLVQLLSKVKDIKAITD